MRLLTDSVKHAESPRWADGALWFSDVHDYAIKRVDRDGHVHKVADAPGRPSGLGRLPDGRWLVVTSKDGKLNVIQNGQLTALSDLSALTLGLAGDMVVDGYGRAYISDTGFDHGAGEQSRPGQVLLFTEGAGVRVVATDANWANGCAVSADGTRFFLAETFGDRISVFTITPTGHLTERKIFAELGSGPDGLCVDEAGGVWVGLPFKREFVHLDASGRIDQRLSTRGALATACVLGGPDRRTLFACSVDAKPELLSQGILDGGVIESTDVDTAGAGWP